jgi:hypothetical protein
MRPSRAIAFGLAAAFAALVACGTDPVGVDACKKIEKVRCESAPTCPGISLERPLHAGEGAPKDVAACIRYYDDQCLHGLVLTKEPAPQLVDRCVAAIINGDCAIVREPEKHPDCAFLIPPTPPAPPPADAASDASTDG